MGNQSDKQKPLLHRVHGNRDPELHCDDLWWYFGCYDYEAGLMANDMEYKCDGNFRTVVSRPDDWTGFILPSVSKQRVLPPSVTTPYSDWHVNFGRSGVFTRGRRIWSRFVRLRWSEQELLRQYYERKPDQGIDDAGNRYGPAPLPEPLVRALHRSYYGLEAA